MFNRYPVRNIERQYHIPLEQGSRHVMTAQSYNVDFTFNVSKINLLSTIDLFIRTDSKLFLILIFTGERLSLT